LVCFYALIPSLHNEDYYSSGLKEKMAGKQHP